MSPLRIFVISVCTLQSTAAFAQYVIVVRHGESTKNERRIHNGDLAKDEFPLTTKGQNSIKSAAKAIAQEVALNEVPITAVFVSPFKRTRQTAKILLREWKFAQKPVVVDDLREKNFGLLEGLSADMKPPIENPRFYLGETDDEILARVAQFYNSPAFREAVQKGVVLVVAHGCTCNALIQLAQKNRGGHAENFNMGEYRVVMLY